MRKGCNKHLQNSKFAWVLYGRQIPNASIFNFFSIPSKEEYVNMSVRLPPWIKPLCFWDQKLYNPDFINVQGTLLYLGPSWIGCQPCMRTCLTCCAWHGAYLQWGCGQTGMQNTGQAGLYRTVQVRICCSEALSVFLTHDRESYQSCSSAPLDIRMVD